MKKILCIVAAGALLAGCSSVGTNFDSTKVSSIQKGVTTKSDLVKMFGQPNQQGVNSDGMVTLTWVYTQATVKGSTFIPIVGAFAGGVNTKNKSLLVCLDNSGRVASYTYSGGTLDASSMTQPEPGATTQPTKSPRSSQN